MKPKRSETNLDRTNTGCQVHLVDKKIKCTNTEEWLGTIPHAPHIYVRLCTKHRDMIYFPKHFNLRADIND